MQELKQIKHLNLLSKQIHENNKQKGFYDSEKNTGEIIALIHSEVSEALEADRHNKYCDLTEEDMRFLDFRNDEHFFKLYNENIKGTFEEEMADIIIRVLDLCAYKDININDHILTKIRYNTMREKMHGNKKY